MKIDELFNKYLDGELTSEEELELRRLLESDPVAKEEFSSLTSVYSLVKEDAESIHIPRNLQTNVEEKILINYLNLAPKQSQKKLIFQPQFVATFVVLFLFLFFAVNIDDGYIRNNNSYFISEILKQEDILTNSITQLTETDDRQRAEFKPSVANQRNVARIRAGSNNNNNNIEALEQYPLLSQTSVLEAESLELETTNSSSEGLGTFDFLLGVSSISSTFFSNQFINNFKPRSISFNTSFKGVGNISFPMTDRVIISTFGTKNLFTSGFGETKIKNRTTYTQSLAYPISKREYFGLTFGFSSFSWENPTKILIPVGAMVQNEADIRKVYSFKPKNDETLSSQSNNPSNDYIEITFPMQKEHQIFWAGVFYEYHYPVIRYVDLVGRLGVGLNNESPIGIVTVYSQFEPIRGLVLNFGFETSAFWSRIPNYVNLRFKSNTNFIYGVGAKINF